MTPELAAGVLAYAASVWTHADLPPTAVHAWSDATPEVDSTTAHGAMRRLARSEEFMPTIARFLTEVRLIEREKATPFMAIGSASHSSRDESAARIAALRTFWKSAAADRPAHNHHNGDDVCPCCSTTDEWMAEHAPQIQNVLRES